MCREAQPLTSLGDEAVGDVGECLYHPLSLSYSISQFKVLTLTPRCPICQPETPLIEGLQEDSDNVWFQQAPRRVPGP